MAEELSSPEAALSKVAEKIGIKRLTQLHYCNHGVLKLKYTVSLTDVWHRCARTHTLRLSIHL